jgi:hypothetical protein
MLLCAISGRLDASQGLPKAAKDHLGQHLVSSPAESGTICAVSAFI